jgi:hypothetical protein
MNLKKYLALLFLGQTFFGCTNFLIRQECDKYNWYQLGFDAALRGERITNDEKVMRCRKAEAEISESQLDVGFKAGMSRYCQPETAYQTGKQGDTLNSDFCDSNVLGLLKQKHAAGNKAYCQDGLTAGQSGKKYKYVCSADFEKTFMPNFKQGRKKYLTNLVNMAQAKKQDYKTEMSRVNFEKQNITYRLSRLPLVQEGKQDLYAADRSALTNQEANINRQLNNLQFQTSTVDKEITEYQTELATLD